ncbi:MAG TPA: AsmA-like C-terminal region-containing protein [Chitinophagaceae bacterium]
MEQTPRQTRKRYLRLLLKTAIACIVIILLFWGTIYVYFQSNKEKLLAKVTQTISERLNGEATIKDLGINFLVNFPYITLRLDGVTLRDSMHKVHNHDLLRARKFFISSSTFQLLTGQIEPSKIIIEQGQLFMFTDAAGYTNTYVTASPSKEGKKLSYRSLPDKIVLKNFRIVLYNIPKQKLYDFFVREMGCNISSSGGFVDFKTDLDLAVNDMAFNLKKGSYAKDKPVTGEFRMRFDTLQRVLSMNKAKLRIGGNPFIINASFHFDSTRAFKLQFTANKIPFKDANALMSQHISRKLDTIEFRKPIDLQAEITGRTAYRDTPFVNASMVVKDNYLVTPQGNIERCSFIGTYNNHVSDTLTRDDRNSVIHISKLTASWEGVPITSESMEVKDLAHPVLTCDIQSNTDLTRLDDLIGSESFKFIKGEARTKFRYHGPLGDSTINVSPYITGSFSFNNAEMEYLPRQIKLSDISGDIIFDSSDIRLKEIKGTVQGSPVTINAEIKNFFALMNIDPGKLELTSSIYTPSLDVEQFKSFLGARNKSASPRKVGARLAKLSRSIDRFMDVCNMNTSLQADKVQYKKFTATDVKGNVYLTSNTWKFSGVSLRHADGLLTLNGELVGLEQNNNRFNLDANLQRINISKLFHAFNNFGLEDIGSENIRGVLTTNIQLAGMMDKNAAPISSTLTGVIDLLLDKGELINFEPLQKMSLFLLKKRDFSNLEFAELKNRFQVQGRSIIINRMEVQSTALSMYVEGLYDLKGDSTDLVIQVPLSNLKKRKADYVPENKGVDAKTGMSVYVRARSGKGDDIDFQFGLFKKKSVLEKRKSAKNTPP